MGNKGSISCVPALEKCLGVKLNVKAHPDGALKTCFKCGDRHRTKKPCKLFYRLRGYDKHGHAIKRWGK
jgi:hypothetical protein